MLENRKGVLLKPLIDMKNVLKKKWRRSKSGEKLLRRLEHYLGLIFTVSQMGTSFLSLYRSQMLITFTPITFCNLN